MKEGRTADIGNVFGVGKVRIKDDAKVSGFAGGFEFVSLEYDRCREDFRSLLGSSNYKKFCFGWVDREPVCG